MQRYKSSKDVSCCICYQFETRETRRLICVPSPTPPKRSAMFERRDSESVCRSKGYFSSWLQPSRSENTSSVPTYQYPTIRDTHPTETSSYTLKYSMYGSLEFVQGIKSHFIRTKNRLTGSVSSAATSRSFSLPLRPPFRELLCQYRLGGRHPTVSMPSQHQRKVSMSCSSIS